jgi:hypothetical protein
MTEKKAVRPKTTYVDNPYISETFADSIKGILFDGQTMRIEFCTTRMNEPKPPNPPTSKQFPACRLVLTPNTVLELYTQLQKLMATLEQQGVLKRDIPAPVTVN